MATIGSSALWFFTSLALCRGSDHLNTPGLVPSTAPTLGHCDPGYALTPVSGRRITGPLGQQAGSQPMKHLSWEKLHWPQITTVQIQPGYKRATHQECHEVVPGNSGAVIGDSPRGLRCHPQKLPGVECLHPILMSDYFFSISLSEPLLLLGVSNPVFWAPLNESFPTVSKCVHTLDHDSCMLLCSDSIPNCYTGPVIC